MSLPVSPIRQKLILFFFTEWTGGIYATPTMLGSRPGGVVAATWASLVKHGFEGYVGSTRRVSFAFGTLTPHGPISFFDVLHMSQPKLFPYASES